MNELIETSLGVTLKRVSSVLGETNGNAMRSLWHWCPGCKEPHRIVIEGDKVTWGFDGNLEAPTFTPSVRHTWTNGEEQIAECCHYFITNGKLCFCADCTHELAGQVVDLPPLSSRKATR